jgi:hypothetical protein
VPGALPRSPAYDDSVAPSYPAGILPHLDVVYGFALTLTGDAERSAALTEGVFGSVHDDLWSTLGGRGLRDRLLARCVVAYVETAASRQADWSATPVRSVEHSGELESLLLGLPWDERAAIALVDQLGLTYAAAAAVLGTDVSGFRTLLHRGRCVLFAAYRAGAR